MGHLLIKSDQHDRPEGITIQIVENGEPFRIEKDDSSGDIYVANYNITVNGKPVIFATNLNSRSGYPLYCAYDNCEYTVFDENGDWDKEFIEAFS